MLRKERPVADVATAADHHQVDRGQALLRRRGDDVDVAGGRALDELARLQLLQPGDLVADLRRALECKRSCRLVHLPLQMLEHFGRLALQEQGRILHVLLVLPLGDQADARAGATLDLVEHAGARAVDEHAGLAGAQLEHLLQQGDALAHGACARKRPEVRMRLVQLAAMEAQLREAFAGEAKVGVALVVAEDDVVARLVRLDEIVLEQQRFAFRAGHRRIDPRDLRHHERGARCVFGLLEVARNALPQIARLAHVERLARGIEHAVDTRPVRQ